MGPDPALPTQPTRRPRGRERYGRVYLTQVIPRAELGTRDLNPNFDIQSVACCLYTSPHQSPEYKALP
jgi:hypothetical protein